MIVTTCLLGGYLSTADTEKKITKIQENTQSQTEHFNQIKRFSVQVQRNKQQRYVRSELSG